MNMISCQYHRRHIEDTLHKKEDTKLMKSLSPYLRDRVQLDSLKSPSHSSAYECQYGIVYCHRRECETI